jgi:isopentenyl diphosphate isomerase/L-lactate dehydrogenase-like FMN-dependent dehydrogenase
MSDGKTAPAPAPSLGLQRQMQIYKGALTGSRLSIPVPLGQLEKKAAEVLDAAAYDYVAGGAAGERTMQANLNAFSRWEIVPRMLRDVSQRDLGIELLGVRLPSPVLLAPIGVQGIVRAEGELASSRAAASLGAPFVLSTVSSHSMEDVARAMGNGTRWFQLYWGNDSSLTASMVQRAEKAGYSALVVTLDTQILGWRPRDLQYPYLPFLLGKGLSNYFSDPVFRARLEKPPEADPAAAVLLWTRVFSNVALSWKDLAWLRQQTRLPILLKGILHPDDARHAIDAGVQGIIVSNHGGRQVDGSIAALDALPEVVRVVQGKMPVLFDSGLRHGADAVKALALGAKAVLLGRPYIWGLAVAGEAGVRDVTLNFLADLDITLGLCGCTSCAALDPSCLRRVPGPES